MALDASAFDPRPQASMDDDTKPQPGSTQPQAPQGPDISSLGQQWSNWIDRPSNRAALMQFGIAMLTPMGFGETGWGHFAGALGHAGEAAAAVGKQELEERKVSSQEELRQAQAERARDAAQHAGEKAGWQAEKLAIMQENLRRQQEGGEEKSEMDLVKAHQHYNTDAPVSGQPLLTIEQYGNRYAPKTWKRLYPDAPPMRTTAQFMALPGVADRVAGARVKGRAEQQAVLNEFGKDVVDPEVMKKQLGL